MLPIHLRLIVFFWGFILGPFSAHAREYSVVRNSSTPTQSIGSWHLKELWKVGPDDDLVFGQIIDVKMDSKGVVIKVMGRQGEGLGETQMARKNFLKDDGGLGLLEAFPASVVRLNNNGDPDGKTVVRVGEDEE